MRKSFSTTSSKDVPNTQPLEVYENIGSRIRKGIYDGIGEDSPLLRGQFDEADSSPDPLFQFRHPDIGVDKFERAVMHRRAQVDSLRSTSAQAVQSTATPPAVEPSAPASVSPDGGINIQTTE